MKRFIIKPQNRSLFGTFHLPLDAVGVSESAFEGGNHSRIRLEAKLEGEEAGWINVLRLPEDTFLKLGEKSKAEITPLTPSFIDRYGAQCARLILHHGSVFVGYFYVERIGFSTEFPTKSRYGA